MVVLAGFAQQARAQAPAQAFQKVMQPYVDARTFMGSVLVARKGKDHFQQQLWHGGPGMEHSKFADDSIQYRFDD